MLTFNHHVLTALDVETTGDTIGYHEICQIAAVPLTPNLEISEVRPFFSNIKPQRPEHAQKEAMSSHGISWQDLNRAPGPDEVSDQLLEWFQELKLPMDKRLIHLTHNGIFDIPFVINWLGRSRMDEIFCWLGRDTLQMSLSLNDRACYRAEQLPFNHVGLKAMCNKFGIPLDSHHDALADSIATAKLYRELVRLEE